MSKGLELILMGILIIAIGAWIYRTMYIHLMLKLENTIELKIGTLISILITIILMGIQIIIGLCLFGIGIYKLIVMH